MTTTSSNPNTFEYVDKKQLKQTVTQITIQNQTDKGYITAKDLIKKHEEILKVFMLNKSKYKSVEISTQKAMSLAGSYVYIVTIKTKEYV